MAPPPLGCLGAWRGRVRSSSLPLAVDTNGRGEGRQLCGWTAPKTAARPRRGGPAGAGGREGWVRPPCWWRRRAATERRERGRRAGEMPTHCAAAGCAATYDKHADVSFHRYRARALPLCGRLASVPYSLPSGRRLRPMKAVHDLYGSDSLGRSDGRTR